MSKVLVLKAAPALALAAPAAGGTAAGGSALIPVAARGATSMSGTGQAATVTGAVGAKKLGVLPKVGLPKPPSRAMAETPFGDEQQMAQKEAENRAAYQRLAGESRQLMREGANINTTQFS